MLPSTGYFKTINCPFYDSGLCERPYCHFKHPRREDASVTSATAVQAMAGSQGGGATVATSNSEMLQQLVSEAVKKVLAHQEVTDTDISQNIVSQVVEGLKPTLGPGSLASTSSATTQENIIPNVISEHVVISPPAANPTPYVYNPTPIAELKKRHIPIASYMPTRDSKIAVKRKTSPDRLKPWLSVFQDSSSLQVTNPISSYTTVKVGEITYKPTAIVTSNDASSIQSYIPTAKSDSSSSNSYEDGNSNDYIPKTKEQYRPKSKKRREEYVPKKLKVPLKTVQQSDETVPDHFEPEFDLIDEIITEKTTLSALASEESQDYDLNAEPKFSDEEQVDDNTENSTKEANKLEAKVKDTDKRTEEKENDDEERHKGSDNKDKNRDSSKSSHKSSSHTRSKSKDSHRSSRSKEESNSSKSREHKDSHSRDKEKSNDTSNKDDSKRNKDKVNKERRSSSTNHDKDDKESSNHDKDNREKHRHSSSCKDKHHSSSSSKDKDSHGTKDKTKGTHSNKDSSSRSKETSKSGKDKDSISRDKSKDRHKARSHDKHRSKSSSKRDKHSSDKSSDKKQLQSRNKSTSSRSSSKKPVKRKRSTSESSVGEHEGREDSPTLSHQSMSPLFEEILEISDSDHDVEEECLKIFQEYEGSEHPKEAVKEQAKREPDEVDEPGRKRVAHAHAVKTSVRHVGPSQPPKKLPNPQQRMYERWRLMREAAATTAAEKAAAAATVNPQPISTQSGVPMQQPSAAPHMIQNPEQPSTTASTKSRLRIAHVPYATSLALAKKKVSEANRTPENKTIAQSSKGGTRVAHVPQAVPQLVRPEPLQVATQKFPLTVRQYYVNLMQDICIQIYTNGDDAAQRAVREEFACHERCKAVNVYKNSCMLAAHRLRKELDQRSMGDTCGSSASGMVSHESVLAGRSKGTWSVVKSKRSAIELKGATLYMMLTKWIMSEQQLRDNGFPRPHPDGPTGRAKVYVINTRNKTILSKVPNERFCSRCSQPYIVDKFGNAVQQQNCIYHWGRKFTIRGEGRYSCCQQYGSATGCCDAKTHVWDYVDYENLRGYVKTLPKDHIADEEQGVYALDCEMSYTTQGLELTRVTVINEDCQVVYETLVKPTHPVIDYNTRFSGITEEQMEGVTTTLLDVQATLLTMFSDKTILVGHSLESDFKAMKLVHDTVVDTSIMFPHKLGYPAKRALRNLCSEYLRKIIQNDVGGHDSNEDAVSCMELILWKVKEEAKLQ